MAKSMVATLPLVLLLLDYWPLGRWQEARQFPGLIREKIPLLAIAAAACVVTALMPGLLVAQPIPFLQRVGNALVSYVVYLRQMIFPADLAAHYPNAPDGQPLWMVCGALVLLAAISAGAVACRKKFPFLLMGWLWYVGMLFPVIGIIQISSDAAHADRYTYLPEIGLAMAAVWVAGCWSAKWKEGRVLGVCLMVAMIGTLTVWGRNQTAYWRNDELLWARSLARTSDSRGHGFNSVAHNGLGNALSKKGNKKEAIAEYHRDLQINPAYKVAHYNLGIALADQGAAAEAIAEYRFALEINPDYLKARQGLGKALLRKGDFAGAMACFQKATPWSPDPLTR